MFVGGEVQHSGIRKRTELFEEGVIGGTLEFYGEDHRGNVWGPGLREA